MKKFFFFQTLLLALVMLVSCSSTSGDFISAYEEATKELGSGTSNDDVKNAYTEWNEALKNATTDNHWFFMVFCTPECAIDYCQRK